MLNPSTAFQRVLDVSPCSMAGRIFTALAHTSCMRWAGMDRLVASLKEMRAPTRYQK